MSNYIKMLKALFCEHVTLQLNEWPFCHNKVFPLRFSFYKNKEDNTLFDGYATECDGGNTAISHKLRRPIKEIVDYFYNTFGDDFLLNESAFTKGDAAYREELLSKCSNEIKNLEAEWQKEQERKEAEKKAIPPPPKPEDKDVYEVEIDIPENFILDLWRNPYDGGIQVGFLDGEPDFSDGIKYTGRIKIKGFRVMDDGPEFEGDYLIDLKRLVKQPAAFFVFGEVFFLFKRGNGPVYKERKK